MACENPNVGKRTLGASDGASARSIADTQVIERIGIPACSCTRPCCPYATLCELRCRLNIFRSLALGANILSSFPVAEVLPLMLCDCS